MNDIIRFLFPHVLTALAELVGPEFAVFAVVILFGLAYGISKRLFKRQESKDGRYVFNGDIYGNVTIVKGDLHQH